MANTYKLIEAKTLTSSSYSVVFSDIPATYTDLVVRVSARTSAAGTDDLSISFNDAPAGTLSSSTNLLTTDAANATSTRTTSTSSILSSFGLATANNTANTYGSFEYYIPSYLASANKPVGVNIVKENNSVGTILIQAQAGLWRDTTAISEIQFWTASDPFISTSSFYLYGISNA